MDNLKEMSYKEACLIIKDQFPKIVAYLQESLKDEAITADVSDVLAVQLKYKYLGELEQLIKNETTK